MLVHVVDQQPDLRVLHEHVEQRAVVLGAIAGARGVGRRVEDDPARLRRDRGFELGGLQAETRLGIAGDQHRLGLGDLDDVGIGGPVGRGDDHLVAGVEGRHYRVEQDLLGAGRDRDLVERVIDAVLAAELVADRGLQFRCAVEGRVFGLAGLHGFPGGFLDVVGGVEIRLAGAEDDHRAAFALQRLSLGADLQDFRDADRRDALGRVENHILGLAVDVHDLPLRLSPGSPLREPRFDFSPQPKRTVPSGPGDVIAFKPAASCLIVSPV